MFKLQTTEEELDAKAARARTLLLAEKKVQLAVMLRGREMTRPQVAVALLEHFLTRLDDIGRFEGKPVQDGRTVSVVLALRP